MNFLANNLSKSFFTLFFLISAPLLGMQNQGVAPTDQENKVRFAQFINFVAGLTKMNAERADILYQFVGSLPESDQDEFAKIYAKTALEGLSSGHSESLVEQTISYLIKPTPSAFIEFFKKKQYQNIPPCLLEKSALRLGLESGMSNLSDVNPKKALPLLEPSEAWAAVTTLRSLSGEGMETILIKHPKLIKKLNEQIEIALLNR